MKGSRVNGGGLGALGAWKVEERGAEETRRLEKRVRVSVTCSPGLVVNC